VIRHHGAFLARVDFRVREHLLIECDGGETHASRQALRYDLNRQNRLALARHPLLRLVYEDIVATPNTTLRPLACMLGEIAA